MVFTHTSVELYYTQPEEIGFGDIGSVNIYVSGALAGTQDFSTSGGGAIILDLSSYFGVTSLQFNLNSNNDYGLYGLQFLPLSLGAILGDGSPDQILQASNTGAENLTELDLFFPRNIEYPNFSPLPTGTQITLSTSAPSEVDVWNSQNPQAGSTPLLGGSGQTSSVSWTVGTDTIPSTLWVGATQGSAGVANIAFTLAITAPAASSPATQGSTEPVPSDPPVQIQLNSNSDPNNQPVALNQDISGQKNITWVVGQNVDLIAQVAGVPQNQLSYVWTVNGPTDFSYVQTAGANGSAVETQLMQNDQGGTGTGDQEIKFFWTGAGVYTVMLSVTDNGVQLGKETITFNVAEPKVTLTGTPTNDTPPLLVGTNSRNDHALAFSFGDANSPGISFNGTVTTNAVEGGSIEVVQLIQDVYTYTVNGQAQPSSTNGYLLDDDANKDIPYGNYVVNVNNNDNKPITGPLETDTPDDKIIPGLTKIVETWSFHTYLMYQPTGSSWVPLLEFNWSAGATVTLIAGADPTLAASWTVTAQSSPNGVITGGAPPTKEPGWSNDYQTWLSS